ncbi:hypothetical protein EU245_12435 [Lentibacillus lipolyticus]|nr:hypothetical protein EU245_12435 [Lentibacillus lipolyticus]
MERENQIISMLETIMNTLDKHDKQFHAIQQKLEEHSTTLKEHGQMLTALRSGQEYIKAELDGFKVSSAKDVGELKDQLSDQSAKMDILKDETWSSKVDIHRIKSTMGMK